MIMTKPHIIHNDKSLYSKINKKHYKINSSVSENIGTSIRTGVVIVSLTMIEDVESLNFENLNTNVLGSVCVIAS